MATLVLQISAKLLGSSWNRKLRPCLHSLKDRHEQKMEWIIRLTPALITHKVTFPFDRLVVRSLVGKTNILLVGSTGHDWESYMEYHSHCMPPPITCFGSEVVHVSPIGGRPMRNHTYLTTTFCLHKAWIFFPFIFPGSLSVYFSSSRSWEAMEKKQIICML